MGAALVALNDTEITFGNMFFFYTENNPQPQEIYI